GLVREGEGIAAGVLESLGVNLERVRAETTRVLGIDDQTPPAPPSRSVPAQPRRAAQTEPVPPLDELRSALTRILFAIAEARAAQNEELAAELEELERRMDEIIERYGGEG